MDICEAHARTLTAPSTRSRRPNLSDIPCPSTGRTGHGMRTRGDATNEAPTGIFCGVTCLASSDSETGRRGGRMTLDIRAMYRSQAVRFDVSSEQKRAPIHFPRAFAIPWPDDDCFACPNQCQPSTVGLGLYAGYTPTLLPCMRVQPCSCAIFPSPCASPTIRRRACRAAASTCMTHPILIRTV